MKRKSIRNVYVFMGLVMSLVALLTNFLTEEYFVFLGIFIITDYMKLVLALLILSILILSVFIVAYKLNRIKLFIGNTLRHNKKIIYLKTNILIGAIGINALLNSTIGFIIKNDLMITLPKIYTNLSAFNADSLFLGYIINNILILLIAIALLFNINRKED